MDNKVTVYPISHEDDNVKKKTVVGTHTSFVSCCMFPNSDQQVLVLVFLFLCCEICKNENKCILNERNMYAKVKMNSLNCRKLNVLHFTYINLLNIFITDSYRKW